MRAGEWRDDAFGSSGSRLASGGFFWWRAVIAHCRRVRPGGSPIPPVPRPRRRTSGVPTASEAHLPTVANPRAGVFRLGAVRTRRSQNAHGFGSGPSAAEKIFLFKKHSKYAFFAVRRRPPLGGSKQFRPPPAPKSWRGTKGEAMPSQSLTACKPCFRHATAHAESKPSSSVSRTSTLERARPSTGDAARNEAAAHRIKIGRASCRERV